MRTQNKDYDIKKYIPIKLHGKIEQIQSCSLPKKDQPLLEQTKTLGKLTSTSCWE